MIIFTHPHNFALTPYGEISIRYLEGDMKTFTKFTRIFRDDKKTAAADVLCI